MPQTFKGALNFPINLDVQDTVALDARLVVDSIESLTDGSIEYPYQGMVVSIAGTSDLYVLLTQGIEESKNPDNWKMVSGDEDVLNTIKTQVDSRLDIIEKLLGVDDSDSDSDTEDIFTKLAALDVKHDEDIEELDDRKADKTTVEGINTRLVDVEELVNGDGSDSIDSRINQTIADLVGGAPEAFNTLKEIADWIAGADSDAVELAVAVASNAAAIQANKESIEADMAELEEHLDAAAGAFEDVDGRLDIIEKLLGVDGSESDGENVFDKIDSLEEKHDEDIEDLDGRKADKTTVEGINTRLTDVEELVNGDGSDSIDSRINQTIADFVGESSAEDDWETENVGGINAGVKASSLKGKSVSEVLDMILYPTKSPSKTDPTFAFTYSDGTLVKVGTVLPLEDSFVVSNISRGTLTYNNVDGNKYYAGASSNIVKSGDFGVTAIEKKYTFRASVDFAAGVQPLNNKGTTDGVTLNAYPGGTVSENISITAVYPILINSEDITSVTEEYLVDYNSEQTINVTIPAEIDNSMNKFKIYLPSVFRTFDVKQFNTNSGKYDIPVEMVLMDGETFKYIRTKGLKDTNTGSAKYEIKLKK